MCLILFSVDYPIGYRLILAANRDEFYDRPTAPLHFWPEAPEVLAGRDLRAGGTWMGITRSGRFAALTNYRDPASTLSEAPTRGRLVSDFLLETERATDYLRRIDRKSTQYNGFNLVLSDDTGIYGYGNKNEGIRKLGAGIYGISNRLLDTPWPKVLKGKALFQDWLSRMDATRPTEGFDVLRDQTFAPKESLPDTGVGLEWERRLSPILITSDRYGTRSSTLLFWRLDGSVQVIERTYASASLVDGSPPIHCFDREYRFSVPPSMPPK
jgi:uncharacterized protein with NRDE domain